MKDNKLKWSIRGALGIVIIITYFHIMPIFIRILNQLIGLYELSNKSPELKLMFFSSAFMQLRCYLNIVIYVLGNYLIF